MSFTTRNNYIRNPASITRQRLVSSAFNFKTDAPRNDVGRSGFQLTEIDVSSNIINLFHCCADDALSSNGFVTIIIHNEVLLASPSCFFTSLSSSRQKVLGSTDTKSYQSLPLEFSILFCGLFRSEGTSQAQTKLSTSQSQQRNLKRRKFYVPCLFGKQKTFPEISNEMEGNLFISIVLISHFSLHDNLEQCSCKRVGSPGRGLRKT